MKKYILVSFLFLSIFISSVKAEQEKSNTVKANNVNSDSTKAEKPKNKKHRRRPLPNGTISLDIIESNGIIHILSGKHEQGKKSLWYQQSLDQGANWINEVKIVDQDHLEANFNRGSDAQLAVQGNNIVAIWASRKEGSGRHNSGPMNAARSIDNGKTWQLSSIPADLDIAHNFFDMDANDKTISAVWLDRRQDSTTEKKAKKGLRHAQSIDGGLTWTKDQTLDDRTCACCWNTAKYSDNDELFVLYRDQNPSDMFMGMLDKQQQWTPLNQVGHFKWDFKGCPHIGGGIAFQNKSQLMHTVVGTGHPDHLGVFYLRSIDHGKSWSRPVQLGDESALHADLAAIEDGRIVAVWDMRSQDGLSVYYSESKDKGISWTLAKRLSQPGFRATHPRIVASESKFITIWTQSADGKNQSLQMQQL